MVTNTIQPIIQHFIINQIIHTFIYNIAFCMKTYTFQDNKITINIEAHNITEAYEELTKIIKHPTDFTLICMEN